MTTRAKMKAIEAGRAPSVAKQIASSDPKSFMGLVLKRVTETAFELLECIKQDTGRGANVSRVLAELFMWSWIRKYADSKYDKLMEQAKGEGMITDPSGMVSGNHIVAESRHFVMTANVTEPARRFDSDILCKWALAEYKVPVIVMKEQIDKSKSPTKPMVRISIAERE